MESVRSKRRRLISLNVQRPDLPAIFESLNNDDTLSTVLEFTGGKSYRSFGGTNKRCREIYLSSGMTKETFLYGYAPLPIIIERASGDSKLHEALSKGVVLYNRRDVLEWALQKRKEYLLKRICGVAGVEGRSDLLEEVWNNVENEDSTRYYIFGYVDQCAARHGKLDVLKWVESKGLPSDKYGCALQAAEHAQLNILQWLKEERGLELKRELYYSAIYGNQLHIIKWLHEQEVPWDKEAFKRAVYEGNLDILQWLHEEDCPWPVYNDDRDCVFEEDLKPEVLDWLHSNGYGNRIMRSEYHDLIPTFRGLPSFTEEDDEASNNNNSSDGNEDDNDSLLTQCSAVGL